MAVFGFGIGKNKNRVYSTEEFPGQVNAIVDPKLALKQNQHIARTVSLVAANWSSKTQTVTVAGVTATNTVIVAPAPASYSAYSDAGIVCTAQAADSLTFTCLNTPSAAISVNVIILGV